MNLFENYLNKVVNKKSEDFTIDDIKPGMWVLLKKEDQLIKNASVGKHWQHEQMLGRWQYVNKIDTKNNLVFIQVLAPFY